MKVCEEDVGYGNKEKRKKKYETRDREYRFDVISKRARMKNRMEWHEANTDPDTNTRNAVSLYALEHRQSEREELIDRASSLFYSRSVLD